MGTVRTGAGQIVLWIFVFVAISTCLASATVTPDWVYVGNPGNNPDPLTGKGSVSYGFQISKYEVTNADYAEFLNVVDPAGANGLQLYNPLMSSNTTVPTTGGINFAAGAPTGAKYSSKFGQENKPVVYTTWYDAARFVNWLQNGQGPGGTETGVYDMIQTLPARNPNATYFLPSEDEWYKSAYHQPASAGGDSDDYWLYPTRTNQDTNSDQPPGAGLINTNVANVWRDDGLLNGYNDGYATTGSNTVDDNFVYLTDVGAYSFASSYYGTLDQGGNVQEWNDSIFGLLRGERGGSWKPNVNDLRADTFGANNPIAEGYNLGFRVAALPEPSSLGLLLLCTVSMQRRRR